MLKNSFTGILYKNISDHIPIFVMNNTKVEKIKEPKFIETRNMNEENITDLIAKVENYDWSFIKTFENVDSAYRCFFNIFKKMYEEMLPGENKAEESQVPKTVDDPSIIEVMQN